MATAPARLLSAVRRLGDAFLCVIASLPLIAFLSDKLAARARQFVERGDEFYRLVRLAGQNQGPRTRAAAARVGEAVSGRQILFAVATVFSIRLLAGFPFDRCKPNSPVASCKQITRNK